MIAICERTSIEITLENATNYAVYALLRLFSIIDTTSERLKPRNLFICQSRDTSFYEHLKFRARLS